jgi:CDP-diacylglycerol--glycerol-3-phosphate 3-phosphatidyltransferase
MNIPNALTLLRIFFVPLLVAVLVQGDLALDWRALHLSNDLLALLIFLAAAATDMLDGYLARRWNQVTTVGMLLDPIADKLLISAALVALVQVQRLPGWMAIVIIGREFAVSGLRSIAGQEGYVIAASEIGKTKMVAQVAAVSLLISSRQWPVLEPAARLCFWGVVVFALISAADYFRRFWGVLDESIKARRRTEVLELERQRNLDLRQRQKTIV